MIRKWMMAAALFVAALTVTGPGPHAGPLWNSRDGYLLFSDIPHNRVIQWIPDRGWRVFLERSGYTGAAPFAGWEPGSNGLAYDKQGRLLMCQHGNRRVVRVEKDGRVTPVVRGPLDNCTFVQYLLLA